MERVSFSPAYWLRRWPKRFALAGSCGFFLLATLTHASADQPFAPQEAPDAGPLPTSSDVTPITVNSSNPPDQGDTTQNSQNSQNSSNNDNSSSQNSDNTGENPGAPNATGTGNTPSPNIPLLPSQALNSSPLNYSPSIYGSPSSPLSAPALSNTGAFDLSQISANNALAQAFLLTGTVASEQSPGGEPSPLDRIRIGPVDIKTSLNLSVVTQDNINAQPDGPNRRSDTEYSLTPAILVLYGVHDGQKGFASLVYAPTLTRYAHYSVQDSDNQNVSLSLQYPFQRLSVNASETYSQVTGVNLDARARTTQTTNTASIGGNYEIDDKFSLQSGVTYAYSTYSGTASGAGSTSNSSGNNGSGGLNSDERESWNTTLSYALTDKLSFGPGFNVGLESPEGSSQQTFEQGLLNINYQPTEKIGVFGSGGLEWRQYGGGGSSQTSPVFSVGVNYSPTAAATFTLSGYEDIEPTSDDSNQTDVNTGVSVSASELFFQRVLVGFTFAYAHTEYKGNGGSATATIPTGTGTGTTEPFTINANGSSQDNLVYRPSLSYTINEWTSVALYYQYQGNSSSVMGSGYYSNSAGLSLSAQF